MYISSFIYDLDIQIMGVGCPGSFFEMALSVKGKVTTGSALNGTVNSLVQILAYLVHSMTISQLYLGVGHFV